MLCNIIRIGDGCLQSGGWVNQEKGNSKNKIKNKKYKKVGLMVMIVVGVIEGEIG